MKNHWFRNFLLGAFLLLSSYGVSQFQTSSLKSENEALFEIIGFHLDLRIQVMKLGALKELANDLSDFGFNTLILEWEGTFPFESHPLVPNKLSYTKKEIKEFITYCHNLSIDVVPLQQSLGHLEYVLRHSRYADQREDQKDVSQLCPLKKELNKELLTDLITEMVELHPSRYFHIGGDEAYLFGHCERCQLAVENHGKSDLFANHLEMVCEIVRSLGKIPILWADVANKYPDELDRLPKETIFIVWNYGWAIDRFGDPKKLTDMGFRVWGAPSLRSNPDNFYLTDWEKHIKNIRDFIPICRQSKYSGMILTSWSTSGVYSTVIEDKQTISELIPVRNVYPLSGFRLLIAAYAEAIYSNLSLDIDQFIINYGDKQFGFDSQQSHMLWNALTNGSSYQVINSRVENKPDMSIQQLLDIVKRNQEILYSLRPQRNLKEMGHFRLMADIRVNYLSFKLIEAFANSQGFTNSEVPACIDQLRVLIEKNESIKERFEDAHREYFYTEELKRENEIRIKKAQLLYDRLNKKR